MALITKIRKHTNWIIGLIALGVLGFILMDVQGNQSIAGSGNDFAAINGKKVSINEFQRTEEALYGRSQGEAYTRRSGAWDYMLDKILVGKESEQLGLGVSKEEMKDLAFGDNLSQVIQQKFVDQATRRVDRNQLNEIKKAIEGGTLPEDGRRAWADIEQEIYKEKIQEKYLNLVSKGIYVPNWMAEVVKKEKSEQLDMLYVKIPYEAVPDTDIKLTDDDFSSYIADNKGNFMQDEETRRISYVVFDVVPSAQDSMDAKNKMLALIEKYKAAPVDSLFVSANSGQLVDFFVKPDKLEGVLKDTAADLAKGTIFGPYLDKGGYMVAKIIDKKIIPDSVKSRHILIQAKTPGDIAAAQKTIDSLKLVIQSGRNSWDSLAIRYGSDATRTKGGDLGYVGNGSMVKSFNDLIFNTAEQGKLYTVKTEFGVHLVEVTGKKFLNQDAGVKFSMFREAIVPGELTANAAEDKANQFLTKNRTVTDMQKAAASDKSIQVLRSLPLKPNDYNLGVLGADQTSYDIIKWGFTSGAKLGEVSATLYSYKNKADYYTDKYVVAGLNAIQKAGLPDVATIRDDIKPLVMNRKKAEILKSKVTSKDLASIAASFNSKVDTAKAVNFGSGFIAGIGNEQKVIAKAFKTPMNQVSGAVQSANGVIVLQPIAKSEAPAIDVAMVKNLFRDQSRSQVAPRILESLRKNAKITDNRYKFF